MVGIVSFGYYFPKFRIKTGDTSEKVVGAPDEDAITIAVSARFRWPAVQAEANPLKRA